MKHISGKDMVKLLEDRGWAVARKRGSHYVMEHPDHPQTVVPIHGNHDLATGTQRRIMRDAGLTAADL